MLPELGAAEVDMVTGLSATTGAVDVAVDVEILKKVFKKILRILCCSKRSTVKPVLSSHSKIVKNSQNKDLNDKW